MTVNARFAANLRLAYKVCWDFCRRRGLIAKDLEAAALYGLWEACRRYDPATGNRFSTFAYPTIVGWMKNEWRVRCREWTGMDRFFWEAVPDRPTPDRLEAEDIRRAVRRAVSGLKPRRRDVLWLRVDGRTLRQIGAEMGIGAESVRQVIAKATFELRSDRSLERVYAESAEERGRPATRPPLLGDGDDPWQETALRVWEDASE